MAIRRTLGGPAHEGSITITTSFGYASHNLMNSIDDAEEYATLRDNPYPLNQMLRLGQARHSFTNIFHIFYLTLLLYPTIDSALALDLFCYYGLIFLPEAETLYYLVLLLRILLHQNQNQNQNRNQVNVNVNVFVGLFMIFILASLAEKKRLWWKNAVINTCFISSW